MTTFSMFETLALMSEGLQVMYNAFHEGKPFPGRMREVGQDTTDISAHEVLERLGLMRNNEENFSPCSSGSLSTPQAELSSQEVDQLLIDEWAVDTGLNQSPPQVKSQIPGPLNTAQAHTTAIGLDFAILNNFNGLDSWLQAPMMFRSLDEQFMFRQVP